MISGPRPSGADGSARARVEPVRLGVFGDLHGHFDAAHDAPLVAAHDVTLCTGDLTPFRHEDRFGEALRQARGLAALGVGCVLGNHDGPTPFTGRPLDRAYGRIRAALGEFDLGLTRRDVPECGLSIVGGRPLSAGGSRIKYPVPGREDWDLERWGRQIAELMIEAPEPRTVLLAHGGPTGLGTDRAAIHGRDFGGRDGDWGDADLRLAIDLAAREGRAPSVVVTGHMHHRLQGGGRRRRVAWDPWWPRVLHVNAAVVPRVRADGRRAVVTITLDEEPARAALSWHDESGPVETEELVPPDGDAPA